MKIDTSQLSIVDFNIYVYIYIVRVYIYIYILKNAYQLMLLLKNWESTITGGKTRKVFA